MMLDLSFYNGKKVLLTGHTGFKGSWMSVILIHAGAHLTGYSTCRKKENSLFELLGISSRMNHVHGDIRDLKHLRQIFSEVQPEVVIHMAAQPIVRDSYQNPVETYEINVLGTVNVLECVRENPCVKSFLNVTTDKVYENKEWEWGYRENEPLDGYDPYSNSKSCSELVTHCYQKSFFQDNHCAISTARAGNVIGGGDFAKDRIIPDCVRAAISGKDIIVRNPYSTRPYQHVLEPVCAYLMISAKQYEDSSFAGYYNVGPDEADCFKTGMLVDLFVKHWGNNLKWIDMHDGGPHEANFLKLDCSKINKVFGWRPRWHLDTAVAKTVDWYKAWNAGEAMESKILQHVAEYLEK